MKKIQRMAAFVFRRPVFCVGLLSLLSGFAVCLASYIPYVLRGGDDQLIELVIISILIGIFLASPVFLTLYNIGYLVIPNRFVEIRKAGRQIEFLTVCFGAMCSLLWAPLTDVQWGMDWSVQLHNSELHTPVATWTWPTLITVAAVAVAGYLILRVKKINRMPPLLAALAIGGMYLGAALCVIWIAQVIKHDMLLCLYPFNLILIAAKVVKEIIFDWRREPHDQPQGKPGLIRSIHRLLTGAENWPWVGLLCALPLLGILIAVLTLFGQAPDSIIQAWAETSDWTFSQQVAPQNIYMDQHYLCTVAAGGHRKIVKPIRTGKRHGHRVLVNRQLCVANAFEQLLEERIPRVHRAIRRFYDRFGYPVAKHIRSAYVADAVWFLMKPLEWFFLAVLYLFDTKPEDRIAVQYPHAPLPER